MLTNFGVYRQLVAASAAGRFPSVAVDPLGVRNCRYRGPGEARCPVGVFLTDEEAARCEGDGRSKAIYSEDFPQDILKRLTADGVTKDQWRDLQGAHDKVASSESEWVAENFLAEARRVLNLREGDLLTPEAVYVRIEAGVAQGVLPGTSKNGGCVYHDPETGKRCVVGLFLTDDEARVALGNCLNLFRPGNAAGERLLAGGVTNRQWRDLQVAHDSPMTRRVEWVAGDFLAEARAVLKVGC